MHPEDHVIYMPSDEQRLEVPCQLHIEHLCLFSCLIFHLKILKPAGFRLKLSNPIDNSLIFDMCLVSRPCFSIGFNFKPNRL